MKNRFYVGLSALVVLLSTQNSFAANCIAAYDKAHQKYMEVKAEGEDLSPSTVFKGLSGACVAFSIATKSSSLIMIPCEAAAAELSLAVWKRGDELPAVISKFQEPSDVYVAFRQLKSGDTKPFVEVYKQLRLYDVAQQNAFNANFIANMTSGKLCDESGNTEANIADATHMAAQGLGPEFTTN